MAGTPPGDALPPAPQRATPARKGAHCEAAAGSPRRHRPHPGHTGRGKLAVRSRGRAAGGETAPASRRPSQRWQATPPGTAPHHPRGMQPPQGMQAKGTVLGPHSHTPPPTAHGWRTPTACPVGGQSGEGQRLTSDAPHNGGRHPPRGRPSPPPQRATLARKGAGCGAGTGSPGPHRPHPEYTGRRTLAARSRGRAAVGGTAPDNRRPSQRWQASPPGDGPPPSPRHAAPTGHAGQGDSAGPPTPTHPRPQHVGGGPQHSAKWAGSRGRDSAWPQTPLTMVQGTPPGTPFRQPHSEQRRTARAHAAGPVLGPHARTDRTRDTRVAEPWLPAPEDGHPGEGQSLTPDAQHNGGRPPPPGTAPHHPRGTQPPQDMQAKGTVLGPHTHTPAPTARGCRTPTARPVGGQSGEGQHLT